VDDPGALDVDARFLLANERTLLAWLRTALTLLAAGVAVEQFGRGTTAQAVLAAVLIALGAASSAAGALRYRRADRALRAGRLPATGSAPLLVAGSVGGLAVLLLAVTLVDAAAG
jgi:putative membrane protein